MSSIQSTLPSSTLLAECPGSDKHCVVRTGRSWFSVPAVSVREIAIAPDLVPVPKCHPALAGLCHLRSEFIPVIELNSLLDVDGQCVGTDRSKLMVIDGQNVWAFQVEEAAAIESLETLVSPDSRQEPGEHSAVIGTAMYGDQIVRVLDPNAVFRLTQRSLHEHWKKASKPSRRSR